MIAAFKEFDQAIIAGELLKHAQVEIYLFSTALGSLFHDRTTKLLSALERGVSIHACFLNPYAPVPNIERFAEVIDVEPETVKTKAHQSLQEVIILMNDWRLSPSFSPAKLQVYLTSHPARMRLFCADPHSDNPLAFIVPSMNSTRFDPLPYFKITKPSSTILNPYLPGIQKELDKATPLLTFLQNNPRELSGYNGLLEAYLGD